MMFSQSTNVHNPSQVRLGQRASMRFNVLVVGEGKIGKSTFISSLLDKYSTADLVPVDSHSNGKQSGVRAVGNLELTADCQVHLFESVGFGDNVNNDDSVFKIKRFLLAAHKKWNETCWNRVTEQDMKRADDRVHCIFYLLAPHKIKKLDIQFLEELCNLAPIVPVVAKADSMTFSERKRHLLELSKLVAHLSHKLGRQVIFDFKEDCENFLVASRAAHLHSPGGKVSAESPRSMPSAPPSPSAVATSTLLDPPQMVESTFTANCVSVSQESGDEADDRGAGGSSSLDTYSFDESLLGRDDVGVSAFSDQQLHLADNECSGGEEEGGQSEEEIQYGLSHLSVDEEEGVGGEEQQEPFEQRSGLTLLSAACSQHLNAALPAVANVFAVVCATSAEGERVYPWGALSIHDERFSDFRRLQRLVVESDQVVQMINFTQQVSIRLAAEDSSAYEARPAAAGSLVAWHLPCLRALLTGWWGFKEVAPKAAALNVTGGVCKLRAGGGQRGVSQKQRAALRLTTHVAILLGLAMVIASAVYHLKALLQR